MSCINRNLSTNAKKLSPLFPKSYFLDFPWWCCFPSGKTLGFRFFFIKFSSNIEKFSAFGLELFNITLEFNEKNLNPSVFLDGKQHPHGEI